MSRERLDFYIITVLVLCWLVASAAGEMFLSLLCALGIFAMYYTADWEG